MKKDQEFKGGREKGKKLFLVITERDWVLGGTCLALAALTGEDAARRTIWREACDCAP